MIKDKTYYFAKDTNAIVFVAGVSEKNVSFAWMFDHFKRTSLMSLESFSNRFTEVSIDSVNKSINRHKEIIDILYSVVDSLKDDRR